MENLPLKGAFDFMMRPQNIEFFSPFFSLEQMIATPSTWPSQGGIRTDDVAAAPSLDLLGGHIRRIFDDPRAKELLITPRGVRLVYQLAQGRRSDYLFFRALQFESITVAPVLLRNLLNMAIAVSSDLVSESDPGNQEADNHAV